MAVNKSFNGTTYSIPTTAGENGWTSLTNFLQAVADNAALKTTHKQNVRQALTSPITISATSDWCVDVRVGSVLAAVTLPAGVEGQTFLICDGYGLFGSYNCTVTPTSGTIQGAGTYVMDHKYQATLFQWSNDRWNVVAEHLGPFIRPEKVGNGTVSFTEFLRLASLTSTAVGISDTQTLTNKTISTASNTVGPLDNISGTLSVSKGGTGLTAVGSALQVLRTNAGATALEWASTGSGDVVGPASVTDNAIARFDGTTGKLVQNSQYAIVDDNGAVSFGVTPSSGSSALNHTFQSDGSVSVFLNTSTHSDASPLLRFKRGGGDRASIGIAGAGAGAIGSISSPNDFIIYTNGYPFKVSTDTAASTALSITTGGAVTLGNPAKIGSSDYAGQLLVGRTNGSAIATGYVGETLVTTYTTPTNYSATAVWNADASLVLTPGVWLLFGAILHQNNGATQQAAQMAITSSVTAAVSLNETNFCESSVPTTAFSVTGSVNGLYVSVTTNTTYYLNRRAFYTSGSPKHTGALRAIRIA